MEHVQVQVDAGTLSITSDDWHWLYGRLREKAEADDRDADRAATEIAPGGWKRDDVPMGVRLVDEPAQRAVLDVMKEAAAALPDSLVVLREALREELGE